MDYNRFYDVFLCPFLFCFAFFIQFCPILFLMIFFVLFCQVSTCFNCNIQFLQQLWMEKFFQQNLLRKIDMGYGDHHNQLGKWKVWNSAPYWCNLKIYVYFWDDAIFSFFLIFKEVKEFKLSILRLGEIPLVFLRKSQFWK